MARLATLRADGRPRLVPIVFARFDDALWSPIDGKPKREGAPARLHDLRRDARATLLLDGWHEDWDRLWWLRLEVRGTERRAGGEGGCTPETVAQVGAALRRKYPQYREGVALFAGTPTLVRLEPGTRTSWMAAPAAAEALRTWLDERRNG